MEYLDIIKEESNNLYRKEAPTVVLCFDNNYFYPAINAMNSIHLHNKDIAFICLCSFLSDDNLCNLLNSSYGVRYMQIQWKKNINTRFYSIDVAFNVYLPWILTDISKCLYVDPDVICKKDIMPIFDSNAAIAMSLELSGIVNRLAANLPFGKPDDVFYYNTGTLFLNLKVLREKYSESLINSEFIEKIESYHLLDQDFFNSFFKNDIVPLPFTWNVQWYEFNGSYFYNKLINEAIFIHFSFHKPWRHTSPFKQSSLYLKYCTTQEMKRIVKKARRKRFFQLTFRFFLSPIRILRRKKRK